MDLLHSARRSLFGRAGTRSGGGFLAFGSYTINGDSAPRVTYARALLKPFFMRYTAFMTRGPQHTASSTNHKHHRDNQTRWHTAPTSPHALGRRVRALPVGRQKGWRKKKPGKRAPRTR